jgi:hypothetical protein
MILTCVTVVMLFCVALRCFQFIADGVWTTSPDYQIVSDGSNSNNIIVPVILTWDDSPADDAHLKTDLDGWKHTYRMRHLGQRWIFVTSFPKPGVYQFKVT